MVNVIILTLPTRSNFSVSFSLFLLKRRSLLSCGWHRSAELNHVVKQMIEASVHVTEEEDSDNKCQEDNGER